LGQRRHERRGEQIVDVARSRPDEEQQEQREHRADRAHEPRAQLDEMRHEAFLVAHAAGLVSSGLVSSGLVSSGLLSAGFSFAASSTALLRSAAVWLSSASVLFTSDCTDDWNSEAACCIESRILRSSSSSTSRLMSALTSAT